jgi:hypothetical protein
MQDSPFLSAKLENSLLQKTYGVSHPKYHLVEFDLQEAREIQPEQFEDPENL